MILTRFVRIQLTIFAVLTVLALTYASTRYLELVQLLGFGDYRVVAEFDDAAGLYVNSNVTYRGVVVGDVEGLRLLDDEMAVDLSIEDDVRIPADVVAEVHSRSAIGEQYLALLPHSSGGPYLEPGSVIPNSRTSVPVGIGPVLENVNALVQSVPQDALTTVVDELGAAFRGTGQALQRFLETSRPLLDTAQANLEPTTALINDLEPVLETQQDLGQQLRSIARDLALFTGTLRDNDAELRGLLEAGQPFATELTTLLEQLDPGLSVLLSHLVTTGEVVVPRLAAVEHLLVVYPALTAALLSVLGSGAERNEIPVDLNIAVNNPTPCTAGFEQTERRMPSEVSLIPFPKGAYCTLPQDAPVAVRGARNTPCLVGDVGRRTALPLTCGRDTTGE